MEGVVPVLEVGTEAEASLGAQSFSGSVFAREQFILEKEAEKLQGVELLGQSLLSSSVTGFVNAKEAHLMGQVFNLIEYHDNRPPLRVDGGVAQV